MGNNNSVSNIIARVGADASPLSEEMKKAQNTILTFKNESLAALKSFGLPHISNTNLVESIQSGQRVVVNFARESSESLAQFQQRVRATFAEAGIDITAYEKALQDADRVHAEFSKGAVKNFQALSDSSEKSISKTMNKFTELKTSLATSFAAIGDASIGMGEKIAIAGDIINTALPELFALGLEIMAVEKIAEWGKSVFEFAQETQDAERKFQASMGSMSEDAEQFSKKLSDSYKVDQEALKGMMSKEYMNTRLLGFNPEQSEKMSEHLTQLSYDLGKLKGIDPSQAFDALQKGVEGQTRGLMELGIRITQTDVKNEALRMGLIKQGQTMTDAQTSAAAYQLILEKTGQFTGYYATQADTLSNQQAALNKNWVDMKRNLSDSLIPAMTGFKWVLLDIENAVVDVGNAIATGIRKITLFAEDVHSAISDIMSGNFGQISQDWDNNYNSIFNASDATKQLGNSMDAATSAANAQNAAQQALGKTLNANVMSFDQVHNLTNAGTAGALAQADAVNNLANSLNNLKNAGLSNVTDDKSKGIVIPVNFKIPPFPPITPPPAIPVSAVDNASPVINGIKSELGSLPKGIQVPVTIPDELEPSYSQIQAKIRSFSPTLVNVKTTVTDGVSPILADTRAKILSWETGSIQSFNTVRNVTSGWETSAVKSFNVVKSTVSTWEASAAKSFGDSQNVISAWKANAISDFNVFSTQLVKEVGTGINSAEQMVSSWVLGVSEDFSSLVANVGTSVSTFSAELHNDFNQVLDATESMVVSWANSVGESFVSAMDQAINSLENLASAAGQTLERTATSAWQTITGTYNSAKNWVADNKSWIVPALTVAGIAGLTIATGGADLVAGGLAAGAAGMAGAGAVAIQGLATGGIVMAPQLAMIGEGGKPEAVIPLDQIDRVMGTMGNSSSEGNSGAGQPITLHSEIKLDGRTLARQTSQYNIRETDRIGTIIGYHPAYNYPG